MMRSGLRAGNSIWFATAIGLLLVRSTGAADDQLELLRAAHRSARESIRSISAKIKNESIVPNNGVALESAYWRSLDRVRIQARPPGGTTDILINESESRRVDTTVPDKATGRPDYIAHRNARSDLIGMNDMWSQMLIDFFRPDGGPVDFDRFLNLATEPPRVSKERLNGVSCWRVKMSIPNPSGGEMRYVIWHDVARNYLVRKFEMTHSGDSKSHFEAENVEFVEAAPGIFVPTRCVRRTRNGDHYTECSTTLSEVRVNEPIPDRIFVLPAIPSGTLMKDNIRGSSYRVDSQWQRTSPEEPLRTMKLAAPPEEQTGFYKQSTREPRSWTWWLIRASLILLIGAGSVLGYRRYRRRATA